MAADKSGGVKGQADSLTALGNLYDVALHRLEDAASFYRRAVDKDVAIGDLAGEGKDRSNLERTDQRDGWSPAE